MVGTHSNGRKLTQPERGMWTRAAEIALADALLRGLDPQNAANFAGDVADQMVGVYRERITWRRP